MTAREIIDNTINEMYQVSVSGDVRSPDWWQDKAVTLNALRQNLEDELTVAEMAYKREIAQLIADGDKITGAKLQVESTSENYSMFKKLTARSKIIGEHINLAKKREK